MVGWLVRGDLRETVSLAGRLAAFIAAGRPGLACCSRHCKVRQTTTMTLMVGDEGKQRFHADVMQIESDHNSDQDLS